MHLNDYQKKSLRTLNRGSQTQQAANFALGLCGEAGEAGEIIKKWVFHGKLLDRDKLKSELGDVLWYLSALADTVGLSLGEIAEANIAKLQARYPEGFKPGGGNRTES